VGSTQSDQILGTLCLKGHVRAMTRRWDDTSWQEASEFLCIKSPPFLKKFSNKKLSVTRYQFHVLKILRLAPHRTAFNSKGSWITVVQKNDVVSTIGCTGPMSIFTSAMGFTLLIVSVGDRETKTKRFSF